MSLLKAAPRARHCTHCPKPGADCCVRVHPSGQHIYAHRKCAAARGEQPMYVFTAEAAQ